MIKNQKQAKATLNKLKSLVIDRDEYIGNYKGDPQDARYALGLNGFNALIADLEQQLLRYEQLTKGQFNLVQPKLSNFHEVLISARIAQNISHKQLAELTGIKEQQIQRYEATDYEGASHNRMIEIAMVLGVNCSIKETWLVNPGHLIGFDLPNGISQDKVTDIAQRVKQNGSIFIQ